MSIKITYFVHGTTTDNEADISSGWNDVDLSELGVKQSIDLRNKINIADFDGVFCSDLKRAIHSAKLTFEDKVPIHIDRRLRECNYGDYNGKPSEIVAPVVEKSITKKMPNGESYIEVQNRVAEFLEEIMKKYDGKHIAIVAHQGPQLALDVILKGKTWKQALTDDWRKTKSWQPGWEYEVNK